ncbi:MAG: hypothetical protein FJ167_07720 [Gammaproteobacteria bacterium]|nr:hypothetical protein [Gammaproteobacteria bacterium]
MRPKHARNGPASSPPSPRGLLTSRAAVQNLRSQYQMHLEHFTIENVGPFKGIQRVDFGFSQEKNSSVICGGNGSGKTSLFKSIE